MAIYSRNKPFGGELTFSHYSIYPISAYKKLNFKSKLSSSIKVRCWKCGDTLRKAQWLVLHNTIHYLEFLQEKENNPNLK